MQPILAASFAAPEQIQGWQHALSLPIDRSRVEELLAADRHKDEWLSMLLHELRSPLVSIQSAVKVLRRSASSDAVVQKMHALIERQVRQLTLLTSDLLDVSPMTRGHLRLQRERIDLRTVVVHAIETLNAEVEQRSQRLTVAWPDVPVWLQADASRLEQVFVNLIANASKYTDVAGELTLSVSARDGHAFVRVQDSGIGIAAESLPHIFDLFVQADAIEPRSRSGFGIGLAVVRRLVELHDGSVTAASAGIGRGSEFTVCLPSEMSLTNGIDLIGDIQAADRSVPGSLAPLIDQSR